MKKKICLLALSVALCASLCAVPARASLDSAAYSPVIVINLDDDIDIGGFIISMTESKTYVLTSVVAGEAPLIGFGPLYDDNDEIDFDYLSEADRLWSDGVAALFSIPTTSELASLHTYLPLAGSSAVSDGETVYRLGIDNNLSTNPQLSAVAEHCLRQKDTVDTDSRLPDGTFFLETDPTSYQVGGPVVNSDGDAVGISVYYILNEDNVTDLLVLYLDEVIEQLDSAGIPYQAAGSSGRSGGSGVSNESGSSGDTSYLGIGLAAGGAAIAGYYLNKKKKDGAAASPASVPGAPATLRSLVLVGGGPMGGARFPLQGVSIAIGRDPARCGIIYPDGTPGISAYHCQLTNQNGVWSLTDRSSHGTFLNGQKLVSGIPYPLKAGDVFYLAEANNSFFVQEV